MVDADRESLLRDLVQEFSEALGEAAPTWRDGHARWGLYRRIGALPGAAESLLRAAEIEPDVSIASAIVVMMLERVDASERSRWVDVLDPSVRRFSEVRSRELGIFESLGSGFNSDYIDSNTVEDWSDWLQLRVVQSVRNNHVLSVLFSHGRTKKIRRLAGEALDGSGR
jgi:hypothetical protein